MVVGPGVFVFVPVIRAVGVRVNVAAGVGVSVMESVAVAVPVEARVMVPVGFPKGVQVGCLGLGVGVSHAVGGMTIRVARVWVGRITSGAAGGG